MGQTLVVEQTLAGAAHSLPALDQQSSSLGQRGAGAKPQMLKAWQKSLETQSMQDLGIVAGVGDEQVTTSM